MADGTEVGRGYVSIVPSMRGFGSKVNSELRSAGAGIDREGRKAGEKYSGGFASVLKGTLGAGLILGGLSQISSSLSGLAKDAYGEARESQKVGAVTQQIIKSTGKAAKISAGQVGDLATAISNKTGIDDEAIQSGSNLLLTFKNVRNETGKGSKIFDRATQAAADLSAAGFGSIEGGAKMLGKALNDPLKGISALGRAGVTFTDQQKKQIGVLTKNGDLLGAQKIILKEVESQVGGVAAASATAGEKFTTSFANLKEQIGTAALPLVDKFFTLMNDKGIPALSSVVTYLDKNLGPAFSRVEKFLSPVVTPVKGFFDLLFNGPGKGKTEPVWLSTIKSVGAEVAPFLTGTLLPALKKIGGLLGSYYKGQAGNAALLFKGLLTAAKPLVTTFTTTLLPALKSFGGFLFRTAQTVIPIVLAVFKQIATVVATQVAPAFAKVLGAVMKVVAVVLPIIQQVVGTIVSAIKDNLPVIMPILSEVGATLSTLFTFVGQVLTFVAKLIGAVWSKIGPTVLTILKALVKGIFGILGGLVKIIRGVVTLIAGIFTGDFGKMKQGVSLIFTGLKKVVVTLVSTLFGVLKSIFGPAVSWIRDKFHSLVTYVATGFLNGMTKVKEFILTPVRAARDAIGGLLSKIKDHFTSAVDGFRTAFDGLRAAAKDPVRFVIETVLENGILKAFRDVASAVGLSSLADKMHVAVPKGFAGGGWTGPGARLKPAGIVHADEHVWTKAEMSRFPGGHAGMERWRAAVRSGKVFDVPGYASGGRVVRPVPGGFGTFPSYPGHTGVDFPVATGTPVHAVMAGVVKAVRHLRTSYGNHVIHTLPGGFEALYAHLSRTTATVGQNVGAGDVLGYSGSTGNSTGPHLHFTQQRPGGSIVNPTALLNGAAPAAGGDSSSSGLDLIGGLKAKMTSALDKLKGLGGGTLGQIVGAIPGKLKDGLLDKVGDVGAAVVKGVGAARWTPTVIQALRRTGLPLSLTDNWVKQIASESGGNPNAIQGNIGDVNNRSGDLAKGLVQVIGATFAAYRDQSLPNDRFNPLANLVAGMRYAKARYGAASLERVIGHGHGYAKGTTNARRGPALVGERGPELMFMRGGETVVPNKDMNGAGLGRFFTAGMVQGLLSGAPQAAAAARSVASGAVQAVRSELGIASPSKTMAKIGVFINQGLAQGLRGSESVVKSTLTKLGSSITSFFEANGAKAKSLLVDKYAAQVKRLKPLVASQKTLASRIATAEKKLSKATAARPSKAAVAELEKRLAAARKKGKGVGAAESALRNAKAKRALPGQLANEIADLRNATRSQAKYKAALAKAEKQLAAARKIDPGAASVKAGQAAMKKYSALTKKIQVNAAARAAVGKKLAAAQAVLADKKKQQSDFAAGVKDSFTQGGSVVMSGVISASQITNTLKARLAKYKTFAANLIKLRKMGLGNQAYQEIIAAGPDQGAQIASVLLKGGAGSIAQVNSLQKQIADTGAAFGKQASQDLYGAGVQAQQGIVNGLLSQQKNLDQAAKKLADALVRAVKKALKIKSPSRVMFEQGSFAGQGMILGVESQRRAMQQTATRLAVATVPTNFPATTTRGGATTGTRLTDSGDVYIGYDPREITTELDRRERRAMRRYNLLGVS